MEQNIENAFLHTGLRILFGTSRNLRNNELSKLLHPNGYQQQVYLHKHNIQRTPLPEFFKPYVHVKYTTNVH